MSAAAPTGAERLSTRVDALDDMLGVLARLSGEATTLLDVLGGSLQGLGDLTAPIHSRATALTAAQRNVAAAKAEADALVEHLAAARHAAGPLAAGPGAGLGPFLAALEGLERSVAFLRRHERLAAAQAALGDAQGLLRAALDACHADFAATLGGAARAGAPTAAWLLQRLNAPITAASREDLTLTLVPPELLPKLQRMAAVLVDAGYATARAGYCEARARALDAALRGVAPETPPPPALEALPPDALERAAGGWARRVRALALLCLTERRLAVSVWPEPDSGGLSAAIAARGMRQLAQAGRDAAAAARAPEKVFALLDMHSQLRGLLPSLEAALSPPPPPATGTAASREGSWDGGSGGGGGGDGLSPEAAALCDEFRDLARTTAASAAGLFAEYGEAVAADAGKILPPDGTVHPLTAQVVGYVKRLLMFEHAPSVLTGGGGGGDSGSGGGSRAAFGGAVEALISRCLDNLEVKARGYRDTALGALFMMNNVHYIQSSVEGGAAEGLLGRPWLERHKDAVEDWGARYQDITWGPLLALVQAEPPPDMAKLKQWLKDTFSSFNAALERVYAAQSAWAIPEPGLRAAVRRVIKADVVPPYQEFLRRYADVQFTSAPAKYIRYAAPDVAAIVDDDLFEAKVVPASRLDLKQQKIAAIS